MVYLYAGLGVAMLAGIMAIFEMGLALTGNSVLPSPQDPYLSNSTAQSEDRTWLSLLADDGVVDRIRGKYGLSLCDELDAVYSERLAEGDVSPWFKDTVRMPVTEGDWAGSCLMNRGGGHRVIVQPPDPAATGYLASKYSFYSCILQDDICPFERVEVEDSP